MACGDGLSAVEEMNINLWSWRNMRRLYSIHDFKFYTHLKQILCDLELANKQYLWLISDIEAYPRTQEYQELIDNNEYLLLTTSELVSMVENDDFQWVWAVFSAIPVKYKKEDILQFDLPYIMDIEEREYNPFMDKPKLQHPYSEFEIYAFDSSYMFIVSDNRELISKFQKCYPKYEED